MAKMSVPIRYWVIRDGTKIDFLLRDTVGAIDRWDPEKREWVEAQVLFDDIYSTDSWNTYAVQSEAEVETIKAAIAR